MYVKHTSNNILLEFACVREPKGPTIARLTAGHVGFCHIKGSIITDIAPRAVVEYSHNSQSYTITNKINIQEDRAIALCCRRQNNNPCP